MNILKKWMEIQGITSTQEALKELENIMIKEEKERLAENFHIPKPGWEQRAAERERRQQEYIDSL